MATTSPDLSGRWAGFYRQLGAEHFDGDLALVLEVVSEEDLGHPALPQLTLQRVPGGERLGEAFEELRHAGHRGKPVSA